MPGLAQSQYRGPYADAWSCDALNVSRRLRRHGPANQFVVQPARVLVGLARRWVVGETAREPGAVSDDQDPGSPNGQVDRSGVPADRSSRLQPQPRNSPGTFDANLRELNPLLRCMISVCTRRRAGPLQPRTWRPIAPPVI